MVIEKEQLKFLHDLGGDERELEIVKTTAVNNLCKYFDQFLPITTKKFNDLKWLKNAPTDDFFGSRPIYDYMKKEVKNLDFDEQDLKSFIYINYSKEYSLFEQSHLGIFSGILLEQLDQNEVYINGLNQFYNCLFKWTKNFNNLILDNFQGQFTFNNIGAEGKINNLIIANSELDMGAEYLGGRGGNIDTLLFLNCSGNHMGSSIGENKGKVNKLIIANNYGEYSMHMGDESEVNFILNAYNNGASDSGQVNEKCKAGTIIYDSNIRGEDQKGSLYGFGDNLIVANYDARQLSLHYGYFDKAILHNIKEDPKYKIFYREYTRKFHSEKIIGDPKAGFEYRKIKEKHNITDLLEFFKQMQGKHYSKEEIYNVKQMVEDIKV
ncbi:hypothetical protein ACFL1H_05495 [Nanoarchaeota archaeon]